MDQQNVMNPDGITYHHSQDTLRWQEAHLYGSSRLGMQVIDHRFWTSAVSRPDTLYPICTGCKRYEITNHLGNVHTIISDRNIPADTTHNDTTDYYLADVIHVYDYYPFGMLMPGRSYTIPDFHEIGTDTVWTVAGRGYRFGFNTQEKVDEIISAGNHYSFVNLRPTSHNLTHPYPATET